MARFSYIGVTTAGKQVKGEINAQNKEEVISLLRKKKLRPVSIKNLTFDIGQFLSPGVSLKDVSRFTRQFAAMTSAGLPLVNCLDILASQTENKNYQLP